MQFQRLNHITDDDIISNNSTANVLFMMKPQPKRKRLAKACDACHKSKRRCDGTAPCSNCYYASKACTYTDASGRSVPAPRPFKAPPERNESSVPSDNRPSPSYGSQFGASADGARYPRMSAHTAGAGPSSSQLALPPAELSDEERQGARKRLKNDRGNAIATDDLSIEGPISALSFDRPAAIELDPALTRELTNLFFTHCHPARAIIHKPNFAADLSHNLVPSYLLHAVCALAAPLSKQPRIRTSPSRFAGKPFAQEAFSLMFDNTGRLICPPNLATAQALCLLQMHDVLTKDQNMVWGSRYHDLALNIVETLGVHSPEHPTLTPVPSPEFIHKSIEREAIRRIFWLIHLMDVLASIYFKKPITFTDNELRLRLPVDETSFELGVHSTLPEYLYLPAVRTQWASEFGHLIRILSIYAKVEFALDELNGRIVQDVETVSNATAALIDAEKQMEVWANSLPEQLRFSEETLQVQQSMFETSSNTGAWCWCSMHVYHASCALALNLARQRSQRGPKSEPQWALSTLNLILNMLGDRAKNSLLMGGALWSLIKYCKRDDQQIRTWSQDYEEAWGTRMYDLVQEWRPQPSPPAQHMYPSQQQPSPTSVAMRRLSEVRHPSSTSGPRPPPHQHGGDASYNNRRSPSGSPSSFTQPTLGRPLDDLRLHNTPNGVVTPRVGAHVHSTSTSEGNSGRDPRAGMVGIGSAGGVGPGLEFGNEGQKYTVHSGREKENGINGVGAGGMVGVLNPANVGGVNSPSTPVNAPPRAVGDGSQSLPSLKASGLLDSWGPGSLQKQVHGSTGVQRASPRRSPTDHGSHALPQDDSRAPASLGMPVGLQWLANESTR